MSSKTQVPVKAKAKPSLNAINSGLLQRKCACGNSAGLTGECRKCQSEKTVLQRRASNQDEISEVPSIVHEVLNSPGQPLDQQTKAFIESRLGQDFKRVRAHAPGVRMSQAPLVISPSEDPAEQEADQVAESAVQTLASNRPEKAEPDSRYDFSRVRVHTDARAAVSAQAVNALAYTVQQDIVFGTGQYAPNTPVGQRLLVHELAHVAQNQYSSNLTDQSLYRKGGTASGFFKDFGRAVVDLFTSSEPEYDEAVLRQYLKTIEETNDIEDDFDSDNKARAVVHRNLFKGTGLRIRVLLIQEMLSGFTGNDDEQAILTLLETASAQERETIAARIGLEELYDNFHGEELDQLYVFYPILNSLHPRGEKEKRTYTVEQYIEKWEKEQGHSMTPEEKRTLGRGCIGITALNLGTLGRPDLSNCYDTFQQVWEAAKKMNEFLIKNFPDRKALIFSKRFWSGDKDFKPDPKTGKVDMSEYTYEAKPGFTNFDYGLYDEKTQKWWHANHCDTTLISNPECGGSMEVYESNLQSYSRSLLDFDRQVFCVGVAILP